MEAKEKEIELDDNVVAYLKKRPPSVVKDIFTRVSEKEGLHKKAKQKNSPPIRLYPTIRVRNRGILSPQSRELYETKKELIERLDAAIRSLVRQDKTLTDCEKYAMALMKKAPKKFQVEPTELKEMVKTLYESYFISVEIKIASEDWNMFVADFSYPVENSFMDQLKDSLDICVASTLHEQEERKKARGPNRRRIDYINLIKDEASRRYAVIKFICERSPDERPLSFNQLAEKNKSCRRFFERKGDVNPELFTALLLSQTYRRSMKENEILKYFDITAEEFNLKGFRRYLDSNTVRMWENSIQYHFFNTVKNGNAKNLTKKGQKVPHVCTSHLAQRDDMEPCDRKGNVIDVAPCIEKGREILGKYFLNKNVTLFLPNPAN